MADKVYEVFLLTQRNHYQLEGLLLAWLRSHYQTGWQKEGGNQKVSASPQQLLIQ